MTRQIKFRAWHGKQKKMYSAQELAEDQLTLLASGKFINVNSLNTKLSVIIESMIPLQFIGLSDKHQKEIYTGDIVRVQALYDSAIGEVVFHGSAYCFKIPTDGEHENPFRSIGMGWYGIEVLGNIYENPELLEALE